MRTSVLLHAGLTVLLGLVPLAEALGQKQCLVFPDDNGRHQHEHGDSHSHAEAAGGDAQQVVFGRGHKHHNDGNGKDLVIASKHHHHALPLLLSSAHPPNMHLAAAAFAGDVEKVTGVRPEVYNDTLPKGTREAVVLILPGDGLGLQGEQELGYLDEMKGMWETFDIRVVEGINGLDRALVIAGSNKRGAVFGLYDLSEQMGISPWYFWDDVHIPHHPTVSFRHGAVCAHGEPTVKYRGLFINDELPVLWNWAKGYYNISYPESPFQVGVYERVFETVLRMKGNFMWPSMWISMFSADGLNPQKNGLPHDPIPGPNQVLADRMGIFMGTSHHEPMGRNKPEWDLEGTGAWDFRANRDNLSTWWEYGAQRGKGVDTVWTLGMRGDGDAGLSGASVELLEEITASQRDMLRKAYGTDSLEDVPQLWAMYKEVQGYYMQGLEVPDDVITLFGDDNFGNIRALLPYDHNHTAGGGIYYHADYVGQPTQYKWINTVNLAKTWEQLQLANAFRTNTIWILNVGDIKHHELPAEHFMHLAYDFEAWPRNSVDRFLVLWSAREFGESHAEEIAEVVAEYTQLVARLKPELQTAHSFSNLNYEESERIEALWEHLLKRATKIRHALPKERRDAFYELVWTPVALVTQMNRMYIAAGRNNQYALQGRTSANRHAEKAVAALHEDWRISQEFQSMLHGKWQHMLSQPHTNAQWALHNVRDTTPPLIYVQAQQASIPRYDGTEPSRPMYVRYTYENSLGARPGPNFYNCPNHYECALAVYNPTLLRMDPYGAKRRWIDVASGGPRNVSWKAEYSAGWLRVQPDHGVIAADGSDDSRVYVSVDWDKVPRLEDADGDGPTHWDNATIHFSASDGSNTTFNVPIARPQAPPSGFRGHVQGDGYVVMEPAHYTRNTSAEGYAWEEVKGYGRTLSALEMYPSTDVNFTLADGPSVEYDIWTTGPLQPAGLDGLYSKENVEEKETVRITVQLGPSFEFQLGKHHLLGISFDGELRAVRTTPDMAPGGESVTTGWTEVVRNDVRNVTLDFELRDADAPGVHTVGLHGMTAGVAVQRVWVDRGGIERRGYSYLGPPESWRVGV